VIFGLIGYDDVRSLILLHSIMIFGLIAIYSIVVSDTQSLFIHSIVNFDSAKILDLQSE
jgi:hypothetical protein